MKKRPSIESTNGTVAHAVEESTSKREERRRFGRSLRAQCPRSSHAATGAGRRNRDPMKWLEQSNRGRIESLLPVRYARMLESPLAYFRGSTIVHARDLRSTPTSGIIVQACGDCHLMNFAAFASPERELIFDISDFDETFPAPFEWDLKRLTASFVIAARWLGLGESCGREAVETVVSAYREQIACFAEMRALEIWYARIAVSDAIKRGIPLDKILKRVGKRVDESRGLPVRDIFYKLTDEVNGKPHFVDQPPLLYHVDPEQLDVKRDVLPFFASYRESLPFERRTLLDRFEFVDVAFKVVGVGSVGSRCFVSLWMADRDDPLILQAKEARRSVIDNTVGKHPGVNQGQRVANGQRLMQSASDIFLGWARGTDKRDYYVRQLRDQKSSADLAAMSPRLLLSYGQLCGETLARAHAKSGEAAAIAGYLGSSANFDKALDAYAAAYADQVESDFGLFQSAVQEGRFAVEAELTKG